MQSAPDSATRSAMRMVAELTITVGVLLVLFVAYLAIWTNHRTSQSQEDLRNAFTAPGGSGTSATAAAGPGEGIAILHSPALGKKWQWVVVEGVSDTDLALGPGHFPDTALPGQVGNFAIAGHRATHGEPFARLNKLHDGDKIYVETSTEWFTYQVTWTRILPPTAVEILAPVAGHPGQQATVPTMTLVTCHPRWGSRERLVVGAQLIEKRPASAGAPADLASRAPAS